MKRDRGQVIILVLVLLTVGALVIVPALNYTYTGLRSLRIVDDALTGQYAVDSALEDALWQMTNGLVTLNLSTPAATTSFSTDRYQLPVSTQIASIATSVWIQVGPNGVKTEVLPNWINTQSGQAVVRYVIRVEAPGQWNKIDLKLKLPQGLTHLPSSTFSTGPWVPSASGERDVSIDSILGTMSSLPNPTPDGQDITWSISFNESDQGNRIFILTFQASGTPNWGVYYVQPWYKKSPGPSTQSDPTAALGVDMYNILISIGRTQYQVVAAYDTVSGKMVIVSYHIVE